MNLPLRALLADDERLARKRLSQMLLAHPEIQVIGETDDVNSTIAFAEQEAPDVIFLDVQMPPGCGFDVLPSLSPLPRIVFVTAYDTFAVRAFDAQAFDYLLKPVHPDRLEETVRRLRANPAASLQQKSVPVEKLQLDDLVTLRDKGTIRILPAGTIAAIEAEAAYSRVTPSGQSGIVVLGPICDWEDRLPSPPFIRLDRSLIINLNLVREVNVLNRDETRLSLKGVSDPLILGRAASIRLRKLF